jgi:hypothetical protein
MGIISVMPNMGLAIELQPAERTQLEQWESAHGTPQQVALRCRIILRAVAGKKEERKRKERAKKRALLCFPISPFHCSKETENRQTQDFRIHML